MAPASFAVNAQLQVSRLDTSGDAGATHGVVFFESSVTDYPALRHGMNAGTDSVLLDSGGDGVRQMAAFLASRCNLTSVGVVAHGAPGALSLGTVTLDDQTLNSFTHELAVVGAALVPGGELDLWSCEVGAGQGGEYLVRNIAAATGAGVAASDHMIGATARGGNWQLNLRTGGGKGG